MSCHTPSEVIEKKKKNRFGSKLVNCSRRLHSLFIEGYFSYLKTGLNEFPLFKTKHIKGYSYASVILENIKKKYLCSFN